MAPSTIFTAILSLSAIVSAAPLIARSQSSSYSNTTVVANTTTAAPPVYPGSGAPFAEAPVFIVYPDFTSQYNSKTGAVDFHTESGLVSRNPKNGGADITTLVTFTLGNEYKSNTCQLVFDLETPASTVSGSKKAQLFTSLAPSFADSTSWPSGNLRNQALGSVDVVAHGRATWEAGSGPGATANGYFPCSTIAGQVYGGEIVPQGDNVEISWPAGKDGVKILVW